MEAEQELFEGGARAFGFDEDALAGIIDPSGQAQFDGQAMDKLAEPDPLDRAPHGNFQACYWWRVQAIHCRE